MTLTDWIGSFGVFLILAGYFLSTTKWISSESLIYIFLNLIGAGMACVASILIEYLPFVVLEGAWTVVSLFSLIKFYNREVQNRSAKQV